MTPAHRVVVNTGILYARMAITVLLSLYATRVVLDALGIEDFGLFNLVGGVIAMLTFLNSSMAAATQRFMSFAHGQGNEGRQHQIFNVSVVLHAGIALLVVGLLEVAGAVLFDGVLKIAPARMHAAWLVYQFAVASTFFTIIGVPYDAVINARENMLLFAVLGVVESILKLAIALALVNATTDKLALYGLLMAIVAVGLLVMRATYCMRHYPECAFAPRRHFSRTLFKEMTAFAGWSLLGSATSMLANYGQLPVMNVFFGATVNAAQGIANQISGQLSVFASTMLRALNPLITKSEGSGDRNLMLIASIAGSKVGFFLLMFIYVPVLLETPYLFELWLDHTPEYTIAFVQLLLIRDLIGQITSPLTISIAATGNIKWFQLSASVLTIFPLPVSMLCFYNNSGPYALYWIYIAYASMMCLLILIFAKLKCSIGVMYFIRKVISPCVVSILLVIGICSIPLFFLNEGLVRLITIALLSLIVSLVSMLYIGFDASVRQKIMAKMIFILQKTGLAKS